MSMIAIHIGLTKCASSTIQKFFASNREALLSLSIDYPVIGLSNNTHRNFYYEMIGSEKFNPSHGSMAELASYWRSAPSGTMVISAEAFERMDREEDIEKLRSHLASSRPQEPIIVMLIIRNMSERLVSAYSQSVKFGFRSRDFDTFFQSQIKRRADYFDIAARWANIFGWDNLRVRPLVASQLINGDIIDDFLSVVGADLTDERLLRMNRDGRRNVSPDWRVLEGIRSLHDDTHGLPAKHPILAAVRKNGRRRTLGHLANSVGEEMGWKADKGRYLTRDQAQQCQEIYRNAIQALNRQLPTPLPLPQDLDSVEFVEREFLPSAMHIPRSELTAFYDQIAERWNGRRSPGSPERSRTDKPLAAAKAGGLRRHGQAAESVQQPKLFFEALDQEYSIRAISHHIGNSAWTAKGGLYAIRYPNTLMFAADGRAESLTDFVTLPEAADCRCLFIDAAGNLYVSLVRIAGKRNALLRSSDDGRTFTTVIPWKIWSMDQSRDGTLYAGTYENPNSECGCRLFKSINGGENWLDISAPEWAAQNHIHGLGIDPDTGWLYVNLGDNDGLDGCWRNRANAVLLAEDAPMGTLALNLRTGHGFTVGEPVFIHDRTDLLRTRVAAISDSAITLHDPLPFALAVARGAVAVSAAWTHKFRNDAASLQFIDIVFKDGRIYLSDDTHVGSNPDHVIVWSAQDDGEDTPVQPQAVLATPGSKNFGAFFLRQTSDGRLWMGLRPRTSASFIWASMDGESWTPVVRCAEESKEIWRRTHSLRDATRAAVGDGRSLAGPDGRIIVTLGDGALCLSPPLNPAP
jgi:hypothetical protein